MTDYLLKIEVIIVKNPYFIMFEPNSITAADLAKYMYAEGLLNDKQYDIALLKVVSYQDKYYNYITVDEHNIWTYTNSDGVSVKYINGYPDFKSAGLVIQEVNIGEFKNRKHDANKANKLAPNGPRHNGNVWHHSEDGETLQEISGKIHKQFTHQGGICRMKGIKKYGI